ncbi:MAG: hypothetical protein ACEQSR_15210 [Candidatus Methylacidiphilales bacterium]
MNFIKKLMTISLLLFSIKSIAQTDSTKINIKYNFFTVYNIKQGNEPISIEDFTRIAGNNIQAVKLIKRAKKQGNWSFYAGIIAGATLGFAIPFNERWEKTLLASCLLPLGLESYLEYKSVKNLKKAAELVNKTNTSE